ncbi:hypothetical protein SteCoe_4830 [Stentor coeruleus]|uniref:C2 domain-containing protein n=1 Tax=Stentor coeruleus TaxID=5963 RepID=A0A1R2CTR4_9CILI|nr:hypothetical protein SteCoe_4830 [Stentor coeruleus]
MGDCYSRPSHSEMDKHKRKQNNENNNYFISSAVSFNKKQLKNMPKQDLEKLVESLEKEQSQFLEKIENSTAGMPTIPEVSIEVQKGLDLYMSGCFNSYKPFIKVTLEPNGPSFSTFSAGRYLPEWYKVVQIKQSLQNFNIIRVSVMLEKDPESSIFFGKKDFEITDLEDQTVRDKWYAIESISVEPEQQPRIKIRIQLVHDEKALYTVLIKDSNEKIDLIQSEIKQAP